MTVETSPLYISDLNASYPATTDSIPEGDDHLRNLKTVLKTTFPNVSGAITPTHTELNYVDGVTSAIQTQIDAKAPIASPTFTGVPAAPTAAVDASTTQIATTAFVINQAYAKLASPTFTGTVVLPATTSIATVSATEISYLDGVTSALQPQLDAKAALSSPTLTGTPTAPTAAAGTATTQIATTAFVDAKAFSSALPAQTGNSGKFVTTDGAAASWSLVPLAAGVSGTLPVANGGTGAATLTANNVLLGNGTSAPQAVAPGTSGNVLTSNGTTWASAAAAGGGIATIASGSLPAAATLDITNIPATYAYLVLEITAASQDTNSVYTQVQVSTNNGVSFDTTATNYMGIRLVATDPVLTTSASLLEPGSATAIGNSITSTIVMTGYQSGPRMTYRGQSNLSNAPTYFNEIVGTYIGSTSAINALRILTSAAGSFDGGTYALYGLS